MISIVTGTLNRKHLLPHLLDNTIYQSDKVELILVDGGSTDGTIEYLKSLNHPNLKLIEVGGRSSYPHFMNLGIMNSKYEYVCQWNDDALLVNKWDDVIKEIDNSDFYLFNWKYGNINQLKDNNWIDGTDHNSGWCMLNYRTPQGGEIVMNYGIYKKDIFRKIGMYNNAYKYYYCDSDMAERAWSFGYKAKDLAHIKVMSVIINKVATHENIDVPLFNKFKFEYYNKGILPENLEYLK